MKHPEKVFDMPFISDDQATKVLQPGKESLDFPTPSASFQPMSILGRIFSGSTMWGDDFNAVEQNAEREQRSWQSQTATDCQFLFASKVPCRTKCDNAYDLDHLDAELKLTLIDP